MSLETDSHSSTASGSLGRIGYVVVQLVVALGRDVVVQLVEELGRVVM